MDTGKKILNEKKSQPTSDQPILIKADDQFIYLTISKEYLKSNNNFDIYQTLMLATSPLFTNSDKSIIKKDIPVGTVRINKKLFPHIAFFIENKSHYTGGRYSIWQQAVLLSNVTNVTIVTNAIPKFRDDFKPYETDMLKIVVDESYMLNNNHNNFNIIVGVPVISGEFATRYAKKFSLPLYLQLFESPNWVSKFRDSALDATEEFWAGYKDCLKQADEILVPSFESRKYLLSWDSEFNKKPIHVIYPCINQFAADYVKQHYISVKHRNKKINLVMSSRMTDFKSPLSIIKKLDKNIYAIHLIGKIWDITMKGLEQLQKVGYEIHIYGTCNDTEKFKIIADSDILIHPSNFEGFGMPPLEALYMHTHVIAYDLPVLREIYGNNILYAKLNDADDFVSKIKECAEHKEKIVDGDVLDFATTHYNLGHLMSAFDIPKITAGMIVYNGEDYMKYAVDSVFKHLYQLIIVEGAVKGYSKEYRSDDGTQEIINGLMSFDHLKKIKFIQKDIFWNDKIEMQNQIANNVKGDYYLKLDHDEIWKPETLIAAIEEFYADPDLTILKMPYYHFWLNFKSVANDAGGKWSTCHPRIWRWKEGFIHTISFNHFRDMRKDGCVVGSPFYKEKDFQGDRVYHFGYVRKLLTLQDKIKYYANRGIEKYVKDTVTNYENGKPTQPTQKVESGAEKFVGTLPNIMLDHPYAKLNDIRKYIEE